MPATPENPLTAPRPSETPHRGAAYAAKRGALLALSAVCALNLWTGAPLFALWAGSRLGAASGGVSASAIGLIVGILAVVEFVLVRVLGWLSATYDRLVGPTRSRRPSAWLRSMRDSSARTDRRDRGVTAIEAIVVLSVVCALVAFEVWFFFFAGSPVPGGGGK